ncbi:MAG TPA: DUF6029 family protein [Ignavibacteria bacterium]|nr:DUF6029 family protein [Ignavibacteria bacterium]
MKKFLPVFLFVFIFYSDVFSQTTIPPLNIGDLKVDASVSNLLRYGNGYEYFNTTKAPKEYFENLTDARLSINDVILGLRYEISDPIEYGVDFKGIKKRFIEYNHKIGVSLRAGDFYDIYSRGLTLNVFEERALAYDTGIDGIRLTYKNKFSDNKQNPLDFRTQIIGGDLEYRDFLVLSRVEKYKIRNVNFDFSPIKQVKFGGSYIYSLGDIPNADVTTNIKAYLPEVNMTVNLPDFEFYTGYARKHINTSPNTLYPQAISADGDGLYSSVSYTKGSVGMTLEYKNYRFDLTNPDNRSPDRPTKMLPFQNPPTAVKEHTYTLISRNPHVVNFNDEVGGQLDVLYVVNDKLTLNLNAAVASEHYEYIDSDSTSRLVFARVDRSDNFIPNFNKAFSPYWEAFVEAEYLADPKWTFKGAYCRQYSTLYNYEFPANSKIDHFTTVPLEVKYIINKTYALKLNMEQQWAYSSIRINQKSFMNQYISLNLTKSPELSLSVNAEFTNDDEEPTGKKFWAQGEALYRLNQSNTVIVSYGSERGGLKCTNGICRFVNPFEGFRLTIQSQF